jgi:hypothetical protein
VGESLEPVAVGPVPGDDHLERPVARGRLDEQVDPLRTIEPVHREDEVAVAVAAILEWLGRVRKHPGAEPCRRREPVGDIARGREQPRGFTECDAIELLHLAAERSVLGGVGELPERSPVELVRLAELVYEPNPLVAVPHEVRGELRRDHHVDRHAVGLLEVEHPPEERLRQHAGARVPLERDRDELGIVTASP